MSSRAARARGISALMTAIPVCRLHGKEGIRIANESVESGKVRSALIRQAWCGLRGGLKHDDGEDEHAEALRPAHHDSVHSTGVYSVGPGPTRRQPALLPLGQQIQRHAE